MYTARLELWLTIWGCWCSPCACSHHLQWGPGLQWPPPSQSCSQPQVCTHITYINGHNNLNSPIIQTSVSICMWMTLIGNTCDVYIRFLWLVILDSGSCLYTLSLTCHPWFGKFLIYPFSDLSFGQCDVYISILPHDIHCLFSMFTLPFLRLVILGPVRDVVFLVSCEPLVQFLLFHFRFTVIRVSFFPFRRISKHILKRKRAFSC